MGCDQNRTIRPGQHGDATPKRGRSSSSAPRKWFPLPRNEALPGFCALEEPGADPSWAAGVGRDGKNELYGSDGTGWV